MSDPRILTVTEWVGDECGGVRFDGHALRILCVCGARYTEYVDPEWVRDPYAGLLADLCEDAVRGHGWSVEPPCCPTHRGVPFR